MPDITFTVTVTEEQQRCIADSVIDVEAWAKHAAQDRIDNKARRCRLRLTDTHSHLLTGDTIPRDPIALTEAICCAPGYMNRVERDAVEEAAAAG